jgi:hypothetical protein
MTKTIALFDLIHALSMQEKRHFKLSAQGSYTRGGQNNYLRLFDAIEKQKKYSEQKIKSLFKKETFISHLPSEKNYLFHLIQRSLRNYHSESNVDVQIKELLIDAEVLQEKSLPILCRKTLRKAKKLAYLHERLAFIPEIVRLESRLFSLNDLDAIYKEEREVLKKIGIINHYRSLSNKVAKLVAAAHQLRSKSEWAAFEKIIADPFMKQESKANTLTAQVYFFYIRGVYHELKGDILNGYRSRKRFVEILEADPQKLEIQARNYMSALNNLGISQLELEKFEDALATAEKIRLFPTKVKAGRAQDVLLLSFVYSSILEMNVHIRTKHFEKGIQAAENTAKGLVKFEGKIHPQFLIVLQNSIKYLYFGAGELKKALVWSNKVLANTDTGIRDDIKAMARIFNLLLHYELGNTDLMEYIIPSTYRFLLKSQRLYKVESIVISYLKRSVNLHSKKEIISSLKKLHQELLPLTKDKYERKAFEEFDLLWWLEKRTGCR